MPRPWLLGAMVVITYLVIEGVREFFGGRWGWRLWRSGPKLDAAVVTVAVLAPLFWVIWIYRWKWPFSLLFAVFGYYITGVCIVAAAKFLSPKTAFEPSAPMGKKR